MIEPLSAKLRYEVVAIAASAGGLRAIAEVVSRLPATFPAAIVVVQHLDPKHPSALAEILSRRTRLIVKQAQEGDLLIPGHVYVAPPDRHLIINANQTLSLSAAHQVHFVRPSADLLFQSMAAHTKNGGVAVVLSGTGNDGSLGVQTVRNKGGKVIVQDEASSEYFGMPRAALNSGEIDYVLPLNQIAMTLENLVARGEIHA